MTTLNNDELREQLQNVIAPPSIDPKLGEMRLGDNPGYYSTGSFAITGDFSGAIDRLVAYIASHDQQLLEAILEGIVDVYDTRGDTQNGNNPKYWTRRTKAINERNEEIRQHIKSVFGKEGE